MAALDHLFDDGRQVRHRQGGGEVERADVTDAQLATGRDALREELVNQRRDRFFSAYMAKAKTDSFLKFVPSGVATVADLQGKGFAYLKVG